MLNQLSKKLSRKGLHEFLRRQFEAVAAGEDVLNVGAGGDVRALLNAYAERNGFRVTHMDIDPERGADITGDICCYEFTRQFDTVVCVEVLGHTKEPHMAVDGLRRALRPGGKLILTAQFFIAINSEPHDYFRFTRYGLAYLLRDFREVEIRERDTWAQAMNSIPARAARGARKGARLIAPLLVLGASSVQPLASFVGRAMKGNSVTSGYVVTARK